MKTHRFAIMFRYSRTQEIIVGTYCRKRAAFERLVRLNRAAADYLRGHWRIKKLSGAVARRIGKVR